MGEQGGPGLPFLGAGAGERGHLNFQFVHFPFWNFQFQL